jgi:DNA-binding transcriptional ArsR family regulator
MTALIVLLLASIGALTGFALLLAGGVLQALSAKEAEAGIRAATFWLLRRAESRLPPRHRRRFREETGAGLQEVSGDRPLWGLAQAVSLFFSTLSGQLIAEFEAADSESSERDEVPVTRRKVLAHPARVQILLRLQEDQASAKELASSLDQPIGNTAYHIQFLKKQGLIETVRTEHVRGITREFYRTTRDDQTPE